MHELSIAQELLRLSRARVSAGGRMGTVHIAVGELASVEPDQLQFAWDAVTKGTPQEGAKLAIDWHAARQVCTRCGEVEERQPGTWLRLCPGCDEPLHITGGDELDLVAVDTPYETFS